MLFRSRRRYRRDTRRASIIEPGGADRDLRRPYLHGRSLYARPERERSFRDRGRLRFLPPAAPVYFIFSIRVIVPALRSEARRVGQEWVRVCRSWGSPFLLKKKTR